MLYCSCSIVESRNESKDSIRYDLDCFLLRDEVDDQEEAVQEGRGAAVKQNFVFFVRFCESVLLAEHGGWALCRLGCRRKKRFSAADFWRCRAAPPKNGRWPDVVFQNHSLPSSRRTCIFLGDLRASLVSVPTTEPELPPFLPPSAFIITAIPPASAALRPAALRYHPLTVCSSISEEKKETSER